MKPLKTFGLAAVAVVALTALIGTGTSSATVLCKNNSSTTACSETYGSGTEIKTSLVSGTKSKVATPFKTIECSKSSMAGKTSNAGGSSETIKDSIETLTFEECNCTVTVLKKGSLEIHQISGTDNGTVTSTGTEVTTSCSTIFGTIHCIYATESTDLGTLTGGNPAKLSVNTELPRLTTSALCSEEGHWTAEYEVTSPKPLYVAAAGGGGGPTATTLTTSLSGESKSGEEITILEGSKAKDTATLSGTNAGKATGKVTYKVYADKECKELVTEAGEVTVSEGKVPDSEEKTLEAGRVYYWQAEYSGDSNNLKSTSTCGKEILTIKASTSLATSLSGESKSGEEITVLEGAKVKDTATLSGTKSSTATGKVKFRVYKDKECKELAAEAGEGSLSEGKASSEEKTLEAGAVYYWQAEYPGDSLHQASTSTCGKEVLTVKAKTSLTTSLSGESKSGEEITILEGSKAKDTATLSGTKSSTATGKVKYKVYADKECKELVTEAGEVTVSEGKVPDSEEKTLEAGRVYYWQASYEGDSLHEKSTSTCGKEILTIKASTSLATSLSGESKSGEEITVLEGAKVKDTATLSGTKSSTATGKVKFRVYKDKECKELAAEAGEGSLSEGKASSEEKTLEAGAVYYWQAEYPGDSLHQASTSTCGKEVLTVKAKTSISTLLFGGGEEGAEISVAKGSSVADAATLAGTGSDSATGTITFSIYSDSECKELLTGAGEVEIEEGVVLGSEEQELEEGVYYWQAEYSGDALHQASISACGDEVETVTGATSVTTELTSEGQEGPELGVVEGTAVSDTATLAGKNVATATGTVKYAVYADSECTELVAEAGEVGIEGEEAPPSEPETLEPGIYYWQAEYSGDASNHAATSECAAEIEVVTPPLTTLLSSGEESADDLKVLTGSAITDSATLWGPHASEATGTVKYAVYADSECTELVAEAGEVGIEGEEAPPSEPETLEPGIYYWQAEYSGDAKNPPARSVCGSETTRVISPTSLTSVLSDGKEEAAEIEVEEGTPVTDAATVSGANAGTATGTVEYAVYADEECTELEALAGDAAVTKGSGLPSAAEELPAGTYYWQAHYLGDDINQESISACGTTKLVVTAPVTTELSAGEVSGDELEVVEETAVTDQATLHGPHASEASGTLRYKIYADEECKELVTTAGEVTLEEKATAPLSLEEELEEGTYYWQAEYLGDAENPPANSTCGTEKLIVRKPDVRKYAALGDSFSSGLGIPGTYYGRTIPPSQNQCYRSTEAWPALVAETVFGEVAVRNEEVFKQNPPSFIFRACQGSVTGNLWSQPANPQGGRFDEAVLGPPEQWFATPAQDLWLSLPGGLNKDPIQPNNKIKLVTVTISGNDVNFAAIAMACTKGGPLGYSVLGCFERIRENEALLAPLVKPRLAVVVANIHAAAPNAQIRLALYPHLINVGAQGEIPAGQITIPNPFGQPFVYNLSINNTEGIPLPPAPEWAGWEGLTPASALERFLGRLNLTIEEEAKVLRKGPARLPVEVIKGTADALENHQLGDAQRWVNQVVPFVIESYHPNRCGHIALARAVLKELEIPKPWPASC